MTNPGNLKLTTQGDREIVMTREFKAPRRLVFDAFTKPELVKQWLLGPPGWSMPVCAIDLKVGGRYRYLWRQESPRSEVGMGRDYRQDLPRGRVVSTPAIRNGCYPRSAVGTAPPSRQGAHG